MKTPKLVRFEPDSLKRLARIAKKKSISTNELLRRLVDEWLRKQPVAR